MKKHLLICIILLSMSIGTHAQFIATGNYSETSFYSCNLSDTPKVCGDNQFGQFGDGTTVNEDTLKG